MLEIKLPSLKEGFKNMPFFAQIAREPILVILSIFVDSFPFEDMSEKN